MRANKITTYEVDAESLDWSDPDLLWTCGSCAIMFHLDDMDRYQIIEQDGTSSDYLCYKCFKALKKLY